jgi:5-methylcytosine-specific restriction endonuclease McrBC regulatory subunit McrC
MVQLCVACHNPLTQIIKMTLDKLQSRQATEHQKRADEIVKNVADRKWSKDTLAKNLDSLYMMGMRHGWESAQLCVEGED